MTRPDTIFLPVTLTCYPLFLSQHALRIFASPKFGRTVGYIQKFSDCVHAPPFSPHCAKICSSFMMQDDNCESECGGERNESNFDENENVLPSARTGTRTVDRNPTPTHHNGISTPERSRHAINCFGVARSDGGLPPTADAMNGAAGNMLGVFSPGAVFNALF